MLIIILLIATVIVAIACGILFTKLAEYYDTECFAYISWVLSIVLGLALLICGGIVIGTQVDKSSTRQNWQYEREYLVNTYNVYLEDYSDDIIHFDTFQEISREISEFNTKISKNEMLSKSIWRGWFYVNPEGIEPIVFGIDGLAQ